MSDTASGLHEGGGGSGDREGHGQEISWETELSRLVGGLGWRGRPTGKWRNQE